jgi:hypothetical protein
MAGRTAGQMVVSYMDCKNTAWLTQKLKLPRIDTVTVCIPLETSTPRRHLLLTC